MSVQEPETLQTLVVNCIKAIKNAWECLNSPHFPYALHLAVNSDSTKS